MTAQVPAPGKVSVDRVVGAFELVAVAGDRDRVGARAPSEVAVKSSSAGASSTATKPPEARRGTKRRPLGDAGDCSKALRSKAGTEHEHLPPPRWWSSASSSPSRRRRRRRRRRRPRGGGEPRPNRGGSRAGESRTRRVTVRSTAVPASNHPHRRPRGRRHARWRSPDDGGTLLDALRDDLGVRSAKDGCSPQGQCGCCTVLVDGQARVACVTPVRRVAGRAITTAAAVPGADRWAAALCATGGSQCGFCTPGIVVRLSALAAGGAAPTTWRGACERACSPTCAGARDGGRSSRPGDRWPPGRRRRPVGRARPRRGGRAGSDRGRRRRRRSGRTVALGGAAFAADIAPRRARSSPCPTAQGGWAVGETLAEARAAGRQGAGSAQRPSTPTPPLGAAPDGDWAVALRTSWCEPGYLETDASWCEPGGEPASPLANGGAFGGKHDSPLPAAARRLADEHGRPVLALWSREDARAPRAASGPPSPPASTPTGRGVVRVARTAGIADALRPRARPRPRRRGGRRRRSADLGVAARRRVGRGRGAGRRAGRGARGDGHRSAHRAAGRRPGSTAGSVLVRVEAGAVLDEVVLRSYCTGAAHQALGWVTSEGLAVADDGEVLDLTVRSFGDPPGRRHARRSRSRSCRPSRAPRRCGPPTPCSPRWRAAVWVAEGCPPDLPTRIGVRA